MATNTPNYNLKKPDGNDFYNVADFNNNADIIDAELKNLNDNLDAHELASNPHEQYILVDGSTPMTGSLKQAQGANRASAATVDLANATGNSLTITGNTNISSFGEVPAGVIFNLTFSGTLVITHNATNLIIPGGNLTVNAGDVVTVLSRGSGNWKVINYQPAEDVMLGSYTTTNPGAVNGKWTKVCTITLRGQYSDANAVIAFIGKGSATSINAKGVLYVRAKQQEAMELPPLVSLLLLEEQIVSNNDFMLVTTQNDAVATIIELYYKNSQLYELITFKPVVKNISTSGGGMSATIAFFSNQPYLDNLPVGTQTKCTYLSINHDLLIAGNNALHLSSENQSLKTGIDQRIHFKNSTGSIIIEGKNGTSITSNCYLDEATAQWIRIDPAFAASVVDTSGTIRYVGPGANPIVWTENTTFIRANGLIDMINTLVVPSIRIPYAAKNGNDAPTTYPDGYSYRKIGTECLNWPSAYGYVSTYRNTTNDRTTTQIFMRFDENPGANMTQMWIRSSYATSDTWTTWAEVVTTKSGKALSAANADNANNAHSLRWSSEGYWFDVASNQNYPINLSGGPNYSMEGPSIIRVFLKAADGTVAVARDTNVLITNATNNGFTIRTGNLTTAVDDSNFGSGASNKAAIKMMYKAYI